MEIVELKYHDKYSMYDGCISHNFVQMMYKLHEKLNVLIETKKARILLQPIMWEIEAVFLNFDLYHIRLIDWLIFGF